MSEIETLRITNNIYARITIKVAQLYSVTIKKKRVDMLMST